MKYPIIFLLCLYVLQGFSQSSVNDFKYVIVPEQFGFQNDANQYRLNQLTKFLLKKYDFLAYTDSEEFPEDLAKNNCLALRVVITVKGTLKTKATVKLLDCYNNLVFLSDEGVSKEKSFNKAYNLSIRDAFNSFEGLNYKYVQNDALISDQSKEKSTKEEAIKLENKALEKTTEATKLAKNTSEVLTVKKEAPFLNAVPIPNRNAYKLINSISKEVEYIIYASDIENTFIIKGESGVIFKKNTAWVRQYIVKQKTVVEVLYIRF